MKTLNDKYKLIKFIYYIQKFSNKCALCDYTNEKKKKKMAVTNNACKTALSLFVTQDYINASGCAVTSELRAINFHSVKQNSVADSIISIFASILQLITLNRTQAL